MALIVEVLAPGRGAEVRERRRLAAEPLGIGRALSSSIVLDDPHVDAAHARLEPQPDGSWALVDLGSVNGIGIAGDARADRVTVRHGTIVTLGRTVLRFRDETAELPPALPLRARTREGSAAWLGSTSGRLAVLLTGLVYVGITGWLGSTRRGAASEAYFDVIAFLVLTGMWAGIWALAARVVLGRFHFLAHAAVATLAVLVVSAVLLLLEWTGFLFPALAHLDVLGGTTMLAVLVVAVWAHLGEASHLAPPRRWRAGMAAAGIVLALLGVAALVEEEDFSTAAEFDGTIKPLRAELVPQVSPEAFGTARADLRAEVDALLED